MAPRGHPDYITPVTHVTVEGLAGLEELAVRLSSIVPWDMEGNVVLMEDFESELTDWYDGSSGGTSSAARSSRQKYSGDWSVKLYKANIAFAEAVLYRYFPFPGLTKYAAFARFCWDDTNRSVYLRLELYSGTQEFNIEVVYDLVLTTLYVLITGDVYHEVATDLDLSKDVYTWYPILVTFDLVNKVYDKLYFAGKKYDISDQALFYEETGADPKGQILAAAYRADAPAFTAYVDDIVLAKNVP